MGARIDWGLGEKGLDGHGVACHHETKLGKLLATLFQHRETVFYIKQIETHGYTPKIQRPPPSHLALNRLKPF